MARNAIETILGAVVLLVAGMFIFFAYNTAQIKTINGYNISASFYKVGGLTTGSDVRISGIKVGSVISREIDPETYNAVINMAISGDITLPGDTEASIASEGILGGMYIRLVPGQDPNLIESGGVISKTVDFRSLEDQVGEIIFLATGAPDGS